MNHVDSTGRTIKVGDLIYFQARNTSKDPKNIYANSHRFMAFGRITRFSDTGKTVYATVVRAPIGLMKSYREPNEQSLVTSDALILNEDTFHDVTAFIGPAHTNM